MKKEGSLKIALSVLIIILVTLVSIWGVYVKSGNMMKNKLPDYKYGMDLKDTDVYSLEVKKEETSENSTEENTEVNNEENKENAESSENAVNNENKENNTENSEEKKDDKKEDIYTVKNYKKAKDIIEKRFQIAGVDQYTIRLDEKTGRLVIEVPTEDVSSIAQSLFAKGKLEIQIDDNKEVIADNKSIENIEANINKQYANVENYGSIVELNFVFNKEAIKKFENIKNTYELTTTKAEQQAKTSSTTEGQAEVQNETGASTTLEDPNEIEDRKIAILLDGETLYTTTLLDFLKYTVNGKLPLSIGGYTNDSKKLESSLKQANLTKSLIVTENLPLTYTSTKTANIHSNISKKSISIVFLVMFAVLSVFLIIKGKLKGIGGALSISGFISSLLLLVRFSNIELTMSSIFALAVMMILEFAYVLKLQNKNLSTKKFNDTTIMFTKALIPVFLGSLVISFAKVIELNGIGQVVFWGLIVFEIFNNIITRAILTNGKNK